ncbi:MAG TPA: hypothetical protein VGM54_19800 [Chthoniobacter sp.]|jgi:hypothetical protein
MTSLRSTILLPLIAATLVAGPSHFVRAADADIVTALKAKGAEAIETKGALTGLSFRDCTGLTAADYQQVHQLSHLKSLSFGKGFNEAALKALGAMPEVEMLSTNGMDVSDEGLGVLSGFQNLHTFAIFHPSKSLTGTGLAVLAKLPHFDNLTVAGSAEFADAGMAAVATIGQLKSFRTWHSGVTVEGVKKISGLKQLTSLTLGQRLANTPPTTLSDAAVVALADCPSLEMLSLQEARLSLPALSQLKKLTHLKRLTLDGIDIPEADINTLKQQLAPVDVRWTAPNDAAKKRIEALFKPAQ